MIRQSAFENASRLLKGGLHCHTTRSDGAGTPEEVIALHEENGYDFLAITDHRKYNYTNFLPGSKLLIVPGMEMDRNIAPTHKYHCFHTVWIGQEKQNGNPYEQDQVFERGEVAGQEEFQPLLDEAKAAGQLTIYCHPQWSGTFPREFDKLNGYFAMELWNSGCAIEDGIDVNNGFIWDDLLMRGRRVYGVATDDGHAMHQHCKGWVRVNAEKNVGSILNALEKGDFYASTGPEIYDFYIDDNNVAHVSCSPCSSVHFICAAMATRVQKNDDGAPITECAMYTAVPDYFPYLRVEVTDAQGRVAWSNPIFLK